MENRKDIGSLVQDTMEKATKTPQPSLWERLDQSLDERAKKKRRALWFWYSGTGILLVLLLGFLVVWNTSENDSNFKPQQPNTEVQISESNTQSTEDRPENISIFEKDNAAKPTDSVHSDISETNSNDTFSNEKEPLNITQHNPATRNTGFEKKPQQESATGDGVVIRTKHLYYNSDKDTTVVSSNKRAIDSLVLLNKHKMAIQDSIARARASDSIKLNAKKKDTLQ